MDSNNFGELVISTVAMPKDTNPSGDIFGGFLVSQMDLGGAILAHRLAKSRITTVAIDKMVFLKPVKVGDRIECYAKKLRTGKSSVVIKIEAWVRRFADGNFEQVTEGNFTFVAIDQDGKSTPVAWPA